MPAPFLSVLIDDCVKRGLDYNSGGARYNNTYVQFVGLGTITDSLAALRHLCFPGATDRVAGAGPAGGAVLLPRLVAALDADFAGEEPLRQRLLHKASKYGNDEDAADDLMVRVFEACFEALDGRSDTKGGRYRIEMLPTTCHVYFGGVTGALPDGRRARQPVSEGISPVQGADRRGPTAKMDHVKTGGTLLNLKFAPSLVADDDGLDKWAHLVRGYFRMDGHHVQFNVVGAQALRAAQVEPGAHRDLIVRVAGYSDYFCDLPAQLQEEIIQRTAHEGF
jgi:formate C-acetyltransferase